MWLGAGRGSEPNLAGDSGGRGAGGPRTRGGLGGGAGHGPVPPARDRGHQGQDRPGEGEDSGITITSIVVTLFITSVLTSSACYQDKSLQQVADIASVPSIDQLNIKIRKSLKGHNAKVVCLDWCSDKRHLVSSAQDGKLIVWVSAQRSCCLVVH